MSRFVSNSNSIYGQNKLDDVSPVWPHDALPPFGSGQKLYVTTSRSWTVPSNAGCVRVRAIGAGGSGASTGSILCCCYGVATGGGGGGYGLGFYTLTPGSSICLTVGVGGCVNCNCACAGVDGGTTSFGNYLTATGGKGGCYCGIPGAGGCSVGGIVVRCGGRGGCGWNDCCMTSILNNATGGGAAGYLHGNGGNGGDHLCCYYCMSSGGGGVYGDACYANNSLSCFYGHGGPGKFGYRTLSSYSYCNPKMCAIAHCDYYKFGGPGAGGSFSCSCMDRVKDGCIGGGGVGWQVHSRLAGDGIASVSSGNGGFPGGGGGGGMKGSSGGGIGANGLLILEW